MNIHLTAIVESAPQHIEAVKALLKNMVVHSKTEAGCLQYELYQDNENPAAFIFHEIWESEEILQLHNQKPYIREFVAAGNLLARPVAIFKTNRIA